MTVPLGSVPLVSVPPALSVGAYLAAPTDIPAGKGPEWGKAAPIGLLIILLLGVAVFFLIKSMNRNLKKVPASFDPEELARLEAEAGAESASVTLAGGRPDAAHGADDEPLEEEPDESAPSGGTPGGRSER